MAERRGDRMQTYTGRRFWPLDPRPGDVSLRDVAHALSQICRYNGHSSQFYSVAEHCVHVSRYCSPENRLWGLMHDAAEAYLCDLIRPVKNCISNYKDHEMRVLSAIGDFLGFSLPIPDEVIEIDNRILVNEKQALMRSDFPWECDSLEPLEGLKIYGYPPPSAEAVFITTYSQITEDVKKKRL